ncbi:hypothetical protein K0M31_010835, partial [Melipona bicolor]
EFKDFEIVLLILRPIRSSAGSDDVFVDEVKNNPAIVTKAANRVLGETKISALSPRLVSILPKSDVPPNKPHHFYRTCLPSRSAIRNSDSRYRYAKVWGKG